MAKKKPTKRETLALLRATRELVVKPNSSDHEFSPFAVSDAPAILDMLLERDAEGLNWFERNSNVHPPDEGEFALRAWQAYRRMRATQLALFRHAIEVRLQSVRLPKHVAHQSRGWLKHGMFYLRDHGVTFTTADRTYERIAEYNVRCLFCRADLATQACGRSLSKEDTKRTDDHVGLCAMRFLIDDVIPSWDDEP